MLPLSCAGILSFFPSALLVHYWAAKPPKLGLIFSQAAVDRLVDAQQRTNITAAISEHLALDRGRGGPKEAESRAACAPIIPIRPFRRRIGLGAELRRLGIRGSAVEVGTQRGWFTRTLVQGWQGADVYVQVDVWSPQANYTDEANVPLQTQLQYMAEAGAIGEEMVARGFAKSVLQCRGRSTDCAHHFPDGSLDFIFIDARHDRKGVLDDLQAYWPKLRADGVIAGHDYFEQPEAFWDDYNLNDDGTRDLTNRIVKGAVDDFFSGVAEESPMELRACPRQVVVSYLSLVLPDPEVLPTWAVRR